jgi:hypothetical protein
MTDSKREYLKDHTSQYVSIGISRGAKHVSSGWVPWHSTGNAFNMRIPNVFFDPEELEDPEIWEWLDTKRVNGCYIFCPLSDYSFLARFPHLQDITILYGDALRDLHFLRENREWFQLHVEGAVLENLDDLFPEGPRKGIHSYCVCLDGHTVKDISALTQPGIYLSELVILEPEGSNDRARWEAVRCGRYSYFEYRLPEGYGCTN